MRGGGVELPLQSRFIAFDVTLSSVVETHDINEKFKLPNINSVGRVINRHRMAPSVLQLQCPRKTLRESPQRTVCDFLFVCNGVVFTPALVHALAYYLAIHTMAD